MYQQLPENKMAALSEYYSVGNIDDFLHVELLCNDQVFFEILKMKIRSVSNFGILHEGKNIF
jgi:hypothetical protein